MLSFALFFRASKYQAEKGRSIDSPEKKRMMCVSVHPEKKKKDFWVERGASWMLGGPTLATER